MTTRDLINFINKNKKPFMFKDCKTEGELLWQISLAILQDRLFYSTDSTGQLSGMILANVDDEKKEVYVTENLALTLSNLKLFAIKAKERWPDYTLRWMKNGIYKNHNTDKVYKKLASI